jgi:hypothetical protein
VELNPHFRDGGDGLPPAAPAAPAPGRPPAGAVGDGGASWRMKALRRAQTQAAEQGKGLSEIVADRWGSVGELTAGLSERRPAPGEYAPPSCLNPRLFCAMLQPACWLRSLLNDGSCRGALTPSRRPPARRAAMAHAHAARDRRGGEDRRPRRPDPRDGEEGEDKAERPQQRRQERGGEERRGGERAGYLEDLRSARSQMRRPSGDEARTGGAATASRRDDRGGERGRGRGRDPLGRRADAEALRAAAGEINAFSADGSFMEQFLEGQRGGGGAAAAGDAAQEPAAEQQQQQQQQRSPASDGGDAAPPARRSPAPSTAQQVEAPRPSAASAPAAAAGGNMSVAAALRARLSGRAPPAAAAHPPAGPPSAAARRQHEQHQEHEHVALPLIDAQGRAAPGAFGREAAGAKESGVRPARRVERYDGGEKRRYYADDDAADLATLVKRTKYEVNFAGFKNKSVLVFCFVFPKLGRAKQRLEGCLAGACWCWALCGAAAASPRAGPPQTPPLCALPSPATPQGVADIDANLARNIARAPRYRATDMDADAEYDHDGGLELADGGRRASKAARRRGDGGEEAAQRDKARQVREFGRLTSALDKCARCFASAARPRHLVLAIGTAAYLALPPRGRLVPGHCQIVPTEHAASTRGVDEAAWTEVRNFKKCLIRMHAAAGLECVFVETALRLGDARSHAVVDCVPLPPEGEPRAPAPLAGGCAPASLPAALHNSRVLTSARPRHKKKLRPPLPFLQPPPARPCTSARPWTTPPRSGPSTTPSASWTPPPRACAAPSRPTSPTSTWSSGWARGSCTWWTTRSGSTRRWRAGC